MKKNIRWLPESKGAVVASALALAFFVFMAERLVGYEISLGVFYLFPIYLIAWRFGWNATIGMVTFSTLLWYMADVSNGHIYSSPFIIYWNTSVRLGYFFSVGYLAARLHDEVDFHKEIARFDELTGLQNRKAFLEAAKKETLRSSRHKLPLSMAYIDLDNFKAVNDQFGHGVGDSLLQVVGKTLSRNARGSDTVARLGGDEFAVLLPDTTKEGAQIFLHHLQSQLLKGMQDNGWPVTFSIGCETFLKSVLVEEMIRRADELMYQVKREKKEKPNG